MTVKKIYCHKCGNHQPHKKIGSSSGYEGMGIARGLLAVMSLGMSEFSGREIYWECLKCGEVRRHD